MVKSNEFHRVIQLQRNQLCGKGELYFGVLKPCVIFFKYWFAFSKNVILMNYSAAEI